MFLWWLTDGKTGLSGVGLYRNDKGRTAALGEQATDFQAETFVILQVVTWEEIQNDYEKEISIYSAKQL